VDVVPPGRGARSRSSGVVPAPGKGSMLLAVTISGASLLEGDSQKGTSIGVEPDVRKIEEFMFCSRGAPDPELCYLAGSGSMPDPHMSDPNRNKR